MRIDLTKLNIPVPSGVEAVWALVEPKHTVQKKFLPLDNYPFIAGEESKNIRMSIYEFGSKYNWKNFLFYLTDDGIMKSRKNYMVGIFSTRIQIWKNPGYNSVCAGTISIGLESGYSRSFQGNPKILGRSSGFFLQ